MLQGDGQGLLPGHKRTAAIIQILREDADRFEQYCFLQESAPYRLRIAVEFQQCLIIIGLFRVFELLSLIFECLI